MSTPAPAPAPEFGRGKTIFVLAIVIGCFAVLWPKIFYPMLTASLSQTQDENGYLRTERPFRPGPELMHPALRERNRALPTMNIPRRTIERESHPGPLPGMRPPVGGAGHIPTAPKGGGTMGIIMPMYTIGIVCFFLYTIMKILFKKNPEQEQQPVKPQVKDYGMDPDHRKYVFSEEYTEGSERSIRDAYNKEDRDRGLRRRPPGAKSGRFCEDRRRLGNRERDARDVEIDMLRRKLEETEAAMEKIMAQMGSVTDQLAPSILAQVLKTKGEELEKAIAKASAEKCAESKEDLENEKVPSSSSSVTTTDSAQPSTSSSLLKSREGRRKSSEKEVKFKLPPEELLVKDETEDEEDEEEEEEEVFEDKKSNEDDETEEEEEEEENERTRPPTPPKSLSKKSKPKLAIPATDEVKQGKWSNASSPDMDEYEVITKDVSPNSNSAPLHNDEDIAETEKKSNHNGRKKDLKQKRKSSKKKDEE